MVEDVALMKAIHANADRFLIECSRIEPQERAWNEEACDGARRGAPPRSLRRSSGREGVPTHPILDGAARSGVA
jgi:hypothetical protein